MLNINIGILGHVDSGKTTLCKSLSSVASTASFDKNPQSQERGITLDLGFSALQIASLDEDTCRRLQCNGLQFTFVDCPGHASLIKTVISAAQIINYMLLIVDVTKGLQAQTLECIVLAQIACPRVIIVLNKVDKLEAAQREGVIQKLTQKFRKTFSGKGLDIQDVIAISAQTGENLAALREAMIIASRRESPNLEKPLLFAIDHCFTIKGKGTICTGTVLQGKVRAGDDIEMPQLKLVRKVKSMQMFRKSITEALQGDRIGICITQFDSSLMERGLMCSPKSVSQCHCGIIKLNSIPLFRGTVRSKMKFHATTAGHSTVLATITVLRCREEFIALDASASFEVVDEATDLKGHYAVLLEFEKPILWIENSLIICSKLDVDVTGQTTAQNSNCRLAFWGNLIGGSSSDTYKSDFLRTLKLFKWKRKLGSVQRVANSREIIVEDFFRKLSNREIFIGFKVTLSTGQVGVIEGTFGKSAKVKIALEQELDDSQIESYKNIVVLLEFKKGLFSENKQIFQT